MRICCDAARAAGLDPRLETALEIEMLRSGGMIPLILGRVMRRNTLLAGVLRRTRAHKDFT
jgi:hypothetical protein